MFEALGYGMRSIPRALVVAGMLAALVAVPAQAQTLDQSQEDTSGLCGFVNPNERAQTFTAGSSGDLVRVELALKDASTPVTVEIRDVVEGVPGTNVFASNTVPAAAIPGGAPGFVGFDFANPTTVVADARYAIVVSPPSSVAWCGALNNPYPGGAFFFRPPGGAWEAGAIFGQTTDAGFRTYVSPAQCAGLTATVLGGVGTPGDDVIVGSGAGEVINGGGGNDVICGRGGDDTISGGAGDDRIQGEVGDDTLRGNDGADRLFGGDGADVLFGQAGADRLFGEAGDDTNLGGADNDTISDGAGDDNLLGELGNDALSGGGGNDDLNGGAGNDSLTGAGGVDACNGGADTDTATCESVVGVP